MLRKISFIFILVSSLQLTLTASNTLTEKLNYMTNYENAIKKAIDTYKPVMMVIKSTTCPWCKKLENQVLQKEYINESVQISFVPLVLNKDTNEYPKKRFDAKGVPTTFFINPLTYEVFHIVKGYKNHKKFIKEIEKAKKIYYKGDKI